MGRKKKKNVERLKLEASMENFSTARGRGRKKNGGHLFYVRSINHFKWLFQQLNDFK